MVVLSVTRPIVLQDPQLVRAGLVRELNLASGIHSHWPQDDRPRLSRRLVWFHEARPSLQP